MCLLACILLFALRFAFHNHDAHTCTHTRAHTHTHTHTHRLLKLMHEMFDPQNVNWSHEDQKIEICVDSNKAWLDPAIMLVGYQPEAPQKST